MTLRKAYQEMIKVNGIADTATLMEMTESSLDNRVYERKAQEFTVRQALRLQVISAVDKGFATSLLPADEVVEDQEQKNSALFAKRKVDALLAKQGMPRSERRSLLEQIKGTQDAAQGVTQDADTELLAEMRSAIAALKQ